MPTANGGALFEGRLPELLTPDDANRWTPAHCHICLHTPTGAGAIADRYHHFERLAGDDDAVALTLAHHTGVAITAIAAGELDAAAMRRHIAKASDDWQIIAWGDDPPPPDAVARRRRHADMMLRDFARAVADAGDDPAFPNGAYRERAICWLFELATLDWKSGAVSETAPPDGDAPDYAAVAGAAGVTARAAYRKAIDARAAGDRPAIRRYAADAAAAALASWTAAHSAAVIAGDDDAAWTAANDAAQHAASAGLTAADTVILASLPATAAPPPR